MSRSALGRYKQSYDEVIASVRESRQVAEVLVKEFGKDSDPKAMRANIEMMQALISRLTREITKNEKLDVKQVAILSGALESLGRASKTDIEMMAKAREQARREVEAEMRDRVRKLGTAQELKELSDAELERRIAELARRGLDALLVERNRRVLEPSLPGGTWRRSSPSPSAIIATTVFPARSARRSTFFLRTCGRENARYSSFRPRLSTGKASSSPGGFRPMPSGVSLFCG